MTNLKRWVLQHRPVGDIKAGDLKLVEEPIRELADGEVQVSTLYLSLDPTNRTLLKVTMEDASAADDLFRILMGDKVEPRREFIEKHALEVRNLDV